MKIDQNSFGKTNVFSLGEDAKIFLLRGMVMEGNFRRHRNTTEVLAAPRIHMTPGLAYIPSWATVTFKFIDNFGGETRRDRIFIFENCASFVSTINRSNFNVVQIFIKVVDFTRKSFSFS